MELVADGARELILVAQDTAAYGRDLPGGRMSLAALMHRLLDVAGYRWLRLMYVHPAHLGDDVIELFGDLNHSLIRQVEKCARKVGGAKF